MLHHHRLGRGESVQKLLDVSEFFLPMSVIGGVDSLFDGEPALPPLLDRRLIEREKIFFVLGRRRKLFTEPFDILQESVILGLERLWGENVGNSAP